LLAFSVCNTHSLFTIAVMHFFFNHGWHLCSPIVRILAIKHIFVLSSIHIFPRIQGTRNAGNCHMVILYFCKAKSRRLICNFIG
jgi:hypothetical protein